MRFDVSAAAKMLILLFSVETTCSLVGGYQRFGGTYCLQFLKPIRLHGVTTHKTTVRILGVFLDNLKPKPTMESDYNRQTAD
jgi:hypothetical protein